MSDSINDRAAKAGIISEFRDLSGDIQVASEETKAALLAAMGLEDAPDRPETVLPRWHVCEPGEPVGLVPAGAWQLTREDGSQTEGRGALPELPLGRHLLESGGERCSHRRDRIPRGVLSPQKTEGVVIEGLNT